jgi:hypothetical protein
MSAARSQPSTQRLSSATSIAGSVFVKRGGEFYNFALSSGVERAARRQLGGQFEKKTAKRMELSGFEPLTGFPRRRAISEEQGRGLDANEDVNFTLIGLRLLSKPHTRRPGFCETRR